MTTTTNYGANKLKRLNRRASVKARLLARKSRGK